MSAPEPDQSPPLRWSKAGLILRFAASGTVLAGMVGLFAYAGGWLTPQALTPGATVNAFETVNGPPPRISPQPYQRRLRPRPLRRQRPWRYSIKSRAFPFRPGAGHWTFCAWGGQPNVADAPHTVHSMALLFKLPDGHEWRTGMNNIPVFPSTTPKLFTINCWRRRRTR